MKTSALLKLHQRQVDLLDMVIKCDNNIRSFERDGKMYRKSSESWFYAQSISHCMLQIKRLTEIKNRLIRYYFDIQQRINAMQPKIELNETESNLFVQNQNQPS